MVVKPGSPFLNQSLTGQVLRPSSGGATHSGMTYLDHPIEALKGGHDFHIPDAILLETRVCDLGVRLEDTGFESYAMTLERELQRVGLHHIKPQYYLADEWFCPDRSTAIAIPFWLAHPRLKLLEATMMGEAEGGTPRSFMQLLRHELGHCVEHAYRLSERRDWQDMFGSPKQVYNPEQYTWLKNSRDFVKHLPDGYAQSHPEEDFAETFAVWLDARSRWRERYRQWEGARAKLLYVDRLIHEINIKKPRLRKAPLVAKATRIKRTLAKYYEDRMKITAPKQAQTSKH